MRHNADKIEASIQKYMKQNPGDRYAILKAMFMTYKYEYIAFFAVRILNKFMSILSNLAYISFLTALESEGTFSIE